MTEKKKIMPKLRASPLVKEYINKNEILLIKHLLTLIAYYTEKKNIFILL